MWVRGILTVLGLALSCTTVWADCPTRSDMATGVTLLRDGEDYAYLKLGQDGLWIGRRSSSRNQVFEVTFASGFMLTGAPDNFTTWTSVSGDPLALIDMDAGEVLTITGTVDDPEFDTPRPATLAIRKTTVDTSNVGGCSYDYFATAGRFVISAPDGSEKRNPAFLYYVPELMLPVGGMWDGTVRNNFDGFRIGIPAHISF